MEIAEVRVNGTPALEIDINEKFQVCVRKDTRNLHSHSIWNEDSSSFQYVLPVTLLQIFFFLLVSRLVYVILRPVRTPKFVCSVLAGILFGPSVLGQNKRMKQILFPAVQAEILMFASWICIAYSIFLVAMKMEAVVNLKNARRTWRFGVIPLLTNLLFMSGLFLLPFFKLSRSNAKSVQTMLSVTNSISTFPVISENLLELNLISSELGQIALSASAVNEVAHWAFITASTVVANRHDTTNWLTFLFSYFAFISLCFFVVRPAMLTIARTTPPGRPVKQGYVVVIQIGVVVAGILTDLLGLSFTQGPFLLGLFMPHGPPLATTLVDKTDLIITHFLQPLYFCYLGLTIDVFAIRSWFQVFKAHFVLFAGCLSKIVVSMLIALSYNIRLKHGLVLGLMLNFKGIIEVIIFTALRTDKVYQMLDEEMFTQLVFFVMAITAITSPLVTTLYKPHTRLVTFTSLHGKSIRTIQNTPRNADLWVVSCVHREGEVRSMITLLEALNPSHANPVCVYVIHLIELRGQSTPMLRRVNLHQEKPWSHDLNYPSTSNIMRAFDNYSHNSGHGAVTVIPCINVAPYNSMHNSVCNLAQDKGIPLILIPFHPIDHSQVSPLAAASIRDLNAKFQAHAPSSVGILVDRHSRLGLSSPAVSFHVGIFFVGGPDDREALALGMRMSERANTSIVLFRFVLQNGEEEEEEEEEESGRSQLFEDELFGDKIKEREEELLLEEDEERRMDESLIEEFMAKKFGDGQVVFHEISVEGSEKAFEMIRCLEGNYDLVMVGRKNKLEMGEFHDEERLTNLFENVETLGMFGDMLASAEFCDGMVPVLVVHSGANRVTDFGNRLSVKDSQVGLSARLW